MFDTPDLVEKEVSEKTEDVSSLSTESKGIQTHIFQETALIFSPSA